MMMMIPLIKRNGKIPRDKNHFWDEAGLTLNADNFGLKVLNEPDCRMNVDVASSLGGII